VDLNVDVECASARFAEAWSFELSFSAGKSEAVQVLQESSCQLWLARSHDYNHDHGHGSEEELSTIIGCDI
jgi:hypothetical protein